MPLPANPGQGYNLTSVPALPSYARGSNAVFEQSFFEDEPANTTPSVPIDPSKYPAWVVIDPTGVEVANGVATPGVQAGRWQFSLTFPPDAPLSTQSSKWRVLWRMATTPHREVSKESLFDVLELQTPDTNEEELTQNYISMVGDRETLILAYPRRAKEVSVRLLRTPLNTLGAPNPIPAYSGSKADGKVREIEEQNLFKYIFETGELETGEYQVLWSIRDEDTSPRITEVQRLVVPPMIFWSLVKPLKGLIDKTQKMAGTVYHYSEGDIFDYFTNGIGTLNGVVPVTSWTWDNFPWHYSTRMYLMEAAALWAIQSQHLAEVDLMMSFSGQTVTLDLDRTGPLEGVIQRLLEDLRGAGKDNWPNVKRSMLRAVRPSAHVGVRAMGRRFNQQVVYTYDRGSVGGGGSAGEVLDLMTRLGLI